MVLVQLTLKVERLMVGVLMNQTIGLMGSFILVNPATMVLVLRELAIKYSILICLEIEVVTLPIQGVEVRILICRHILWLLFGNERLKGEIK